MKQNLLEAFSELIREEILDQPHLVRKVSLGVQNLVNSDELSQRHPIRKLGLKQCFFSIFERFYFQVWIGCE